MTTPPKNTGEEPRRARKNLTAGLALVLIGLLALAVQYLESDALGLLFLPALGAIFLLWGISARQFGFIIPGGILSGLGLGVYLIEGPLASLESTASGGVILICFALGWGLISLLSVPLTGHLEWRPLIPAGIMALIGASLAAGGEALRFLMQIGQSWPLVFIAAGLYLILWRRGMRR